MTFAALTHTKIGGATGGTTPSIDTTGAKLLTLTVAWGTGGATVSDSKGNTWTQRVLRSSTPNVAVYDCLSPTVGTGHTFTIAATNGALCAQAFSVTGTPSFDASAQGSNGSSLNHISGTVSLVPAGNDEVIVSAGGFSSAYGGTLSAGSGWTLGDQQNYVSSTNYGIDLTYQIQTTATTIAANTITSSWTSSAMATDNVSAAYKETVADTLTITSPKQYEIHSRTTTGGTTGSIQIGFTTTGSTEDIEAKFDITGGAAGSYQTIKSAHAPGAGTGTLTGQALGTGTLTVRKKVTTATSATLANVGVGINLGAVGDSRSSGRSTNLQTYTHATRKASDFRGDDLWKDGNDPSSWTSALGSIHPIVATMLMADLGIPVGWVTAGEGSTDLWGTSIDGWTKPGTQYTKLQSTVTNSTVARLEGVVGFFGPNTSHYASGTVTKSQYRTAINNFASNVAADIAGAPPVFIDVMGQDTTGSPPDRRAAQDNIRAAIIEAAAGGNIKLGPNLLGSSYSDGVHFATDAETRLVAGRYYLCLKEHLYGGAAGSSRGPRFSSATWNGSRNQMTVVFDRALKTGLTHSAAAWKVSDNGSAMTVSSVAYHLSNPNALLINTSSAAVGPANTTTVTFGSGEDATGVVIPLSTDISLPAGFSAIQIPAEPIYAGAVGEFVSLATTVTLTLTTDGTTPAASLSGLRWAFFDQPLPNNQTAPTAKGTGATTNGSGVFTVSITGTALVVGAVGWLVVTDSDGTTSQTPMKGFAGPVTVS